MEKTKLEKIKALENAGEVLKTEFVGLDEIIDEIITVFKSWYVTPEVNERPSVISLFGMTGTGKTSLIRRLIEILELSHKTLFFDCGTESNDGSSESVADKISKFLNAEDAEYNIDDYSKDLIFVFDEFQYSRTIDESGTEVQKSNLRSVWELVDNGTINLNQNDWDLNYVSGFIEDLRAFSRSYPGIKLNSEGEITDRKDIENFLNNLGFFYYDRGVPGLLGSKERFSSRTGTELKDIEDPCAKPLRVLEDRTIRVIVRRLNTRDNTKNVETMKDLINCGTIDELVQKLENIHPQISAPRTIKCPKALVILLGNIDEAFRVEGNITPDLDADIFYDETSKVTINDIKKALKKRFRAEQIARLGNTIIKYPTLRGSDFKMIIGREVRRILARFRESSGINVRATTRVFDLLYSEGVYPAQGVRPVFTTISTILTPLLSDILINKTDKFGEGEVVIDVDSKNGFNVPEIHISLTHSSDPEQDFGRTIKLSLGSLRNPKGRKTRYVCSVHEIGHAIVISYLTGKIPSTIVSVSSSGGGFCTSYDPDKIGEVETRRDIKNSVMISMAGYEAEHIIFGSDKDMTLMGSSSDIESAWESLSEAAYSCGYFIPVKFGNREVENSSEIPFGLDDRSGLEESIRIEFEKLRRETQDILKKNKNLLIQASIKLGETGKMTNSEFLDFIKEHGKTLTEDRLEEAKKLNSPEYYLKELLKK